MSKTEYVRFEVCDFYGISRSKLVPARHKDSKVFMYGGTLGLGPCCTAMEKCHGITLFDEITATGCGNGMLVPDWDTLKVVPHASTNGRTISRVLCEQEDYDAVPGTGKMQMANPRTVLKTQLEALKAHGGMNYELLSAHELEFTLMKPKVGAATVGPATPGTTVNVDDWEPASDGIDIFSTLQNAKTAEFQYALQESMIDMGVDIGTLNPEYGEGQLEITYAPSWGLTSGDNTFTYKNSVKEIAMNMGLHATFMAKPFAGGASNGGHTNHSLWTTDASGVRRNAFHDADSEDGLSQTAKFWIGGLLKHLPALQALGSPTMSCYNRVADWTWAPTSAIWGFENRTAAVRAKVGGESGTYFEWRAPSASANPYLVLAGIVAAGLDGVKNKILPEDDAYCTGDGYATPAKVKVPTSLPAALDAFDADDALKEALGEQFSTWYLKVKRAECAEFPDEAVPEGDEAAAAERKAAVDALCKKLYQPLI